MSTDALYWLASVFLWLYFTGIGLPPVPEEAGILYAASIKSLHPEVFWWMAWPAAGLGILCADMTLYGLGRLLGQRLFQYRWFNRILPPERRERLQERFHQHGMKFLLMARLLPPLRTGIFLMAGSMHYPFVLFIIADMVYCVIGVGLIFFGGAALVQLISYFGSWLLVAVAVAVVVYLLYRYYRYLKKLELKAAARVLKAIVPEESASPSEKQQVSP